jgi:hypothetical protein
MDAIKALDDARKPTTENPRSESGMFLLWSIEHDQWWGPGERGYTRELREAGRYPAERAQQIVARANLVKFHECMIPLECASPTGPERVHCMRCGKSVSGFDPELGLVVRAWVECPECLEKSGAAAEGT